MAAYAALLSLKHIIYETQQHPRPPISFHQQHLNSLTQNLIFLQDFFERYSTRFSKEEEALESRISAVAYAAEDVIESHIVDQIHARSTSHGGNLSCVDFYQGLERVIKDMDLIKKEVMKIVEEKMESEDHHQLMITNSSASIGPIRPISRMQNNIVLDFGNILIDIMDKLTRQECHLEIVPIVGMGGTGKTTLAMNIYEHPLIVQHFDFLAWVTISQEYSVREILAQVICEENNGVQMSEDHELGERVYKKLWGRRYLIVMDDIWSIEAWDKVKAYFPNNSEGSKIMITTRNSKLAFELSGSHDFKMKFLDEHKSWDLLCNIVFGKEDCPIELENIGKEIARNCRGLPLSIVVTGGLLAKSKMTWNEWECTLENLSSLINLVDNEHCFQILRMSYKELPIHLKPCFLYMGAFPEDDKIHVSRLIRLWVSEGFLESSDGKSLEVVGEKYFKELIERNLILVHAFGSSGMVKYCKIHDLLRDLCLREAQNQNFLCVLRSQDLNIPKGINTERHICIHEKTDQSSPQILHALESAYLARSLLINGFYEPTPSPNHKLLRIYSWVHKRHTHIRGLSRVEPIFQQANLRYLFLVFPRLSKFPSWSLLWNLQTIYFIVRSRCLLTLPSEIWMMSRLRHVKFRRVLLPNPSYEKNTVLENLQTLSCVRNLKCSDDVLKRIPNIKKLKLLYVRKRLEKEGASKLCLNNLGRLQNLESLRLCITTSSPNSTPKILGSHLVQNLTFPHSIKKLTLQGTLLHWEELTNIGLLPHLEVLKLRKNACIGPEWKTGDEQFCNLKFLLIESCDDLRYWTTDSTHFPSLQRLRLRRLKHLNEIPSSIGDIPTMQSIHLVFCSTSAKVSAEVIKSEQEELGNVDLKFYIRRHRLVFSHPRNQ